MSHPYGAPSASPATRPTISDMVEGPDGKSFTLRFLPGQRLPNHRNGSRIRIAATAGSGVLLVEGLEARVLAAGESVQLEPNVTHSLEAGDTPWDVSVHLIAGCCPGCA